MKTPRDFARAPDIPRRPRSRGTRSTRSATRPQPCSAQTLTTGYLKKSAFAAKKKPLRRDAWTSRREALAGRAMGMPKTTKKDGGFRRRALGEACWLSFRSILSPVVQDIPAIKAVRRRWWEELETGGNEGSL